VGALAYWDAQRESVSTLSDFAEQESTLAQALGVTLKMRLQVIARDAQLACESPLPAHLRTAYAAMHLRDANAPPIAAREPNAIGFSVPCYDPARVADITLASSALMVGAAAIERHAGTLLLVAPPHSDQFLTPDGAVVASPPLVRTIAEGATHVRLSRADSAALGLPERTAMAGLSHVDAGPLGQWGVVAVASAERVRDRQFRSQWRLALSIGVAAALVLAFGGVALRRQAKAYALSHRLALAELQSQRDERLARANRAATLGTLAMGITHELSTPLGIIAGRADQLAARALDPSKVQKFAQIILEQSEHIGRVIRSFLSLARGDSPSASAIAPEALARGAAMLVAHVCEKAGVSLSHDVAADLPAIFGDKQLLEHALVNLLLNACHACPPGGHVHLSARAALDAITFIVDDDGRGISEAVALRATEPFFTTKPAGTGLGLAIVNEVVKAHRGTLTLTARTPRGTRACIALPAQRPSEGGAS
jgi:signal transduction histidine kinase